MNQQVEQLSVEMSAETFELHRCLVWKWFGNSGASWVYKSQVTRRGGEEFAEQFLGIGWVNLVGGKYYLTPEGTKAVAHYWSEESRRSASETRAMLEALGMVAK